VVHRDLSKNKNEGKQTTLESQCLMKKAIINKKTRFYIYTKARKGERVGEEGRGVVGKIIDAL